MKGKATEAHKLKFYDNVILLGYFVMKEKVEFNNAVSNITFPFPTTHIE